MFIWFNSACRPANGINGSVATSTTLRPRRLICPRTARNQVLLPNNENGGASPAELGARGGEQSWQRLRWLTSARASNSSIRIKWARPCRKESSPGPLFPPLRQLPRRRADLLALLDEKGRNRRGDDDSQLGGTGRLWIWYASALRSRKILVSSAIAD